MSVQVKSSGSSPTLQSRTVNPSSSTQYITAQTGYDALSQVTVYGDSNLVSSNIKSGVSIFGVNGSAKSPFKFRETEVIPSGNGVSTLTVPVKAQVNKIYSIYVFFKRLSLRLNNLGIATRSIVTLYQYSENGMSTRNYDPLVTRSEGALFYDELRIQYQPAAFDWQPSGTNIILSFTNNDGSLCFGKGNYQRILDYGYLIQLWYE